jgi:hypothetical protein
MDNAARPDPQSACDNVEMTGRPQLATSGTEPQPKYS